MRPRKPAHYTDRKKESVIFTRIRSSVLPLQNGTIFAVDTSTNVSTPHTKFQQNDFKHFRDMRLQKLAQFLQLFLIFFLFSHTYKNCHKMLIPYLITIGGGYKGTS